jgi:hypothetical protein
MVALNGDYWSSGFPPGTRIAILLPLSRIWSSFVTLMPSGVVSYASTCSSTMLTKTSNPFKVPTSSLSPTRCPALQRQIVSDCEAQAPLQGSPKNLYNMRRHQPPECSPFMIIQTLDPMQRSINSAGRRWETFEPCPCLVLIIPPPYR